MRRARDWIIGGIAVVLVFGALHSLRILGTYLYVTNTKETLAKAGGDWLAPMNSKWERLSAGKAYSIQRVSDPAFQGQDSLRFELRAGDAWIHGSEPTFRSELETHDRAPMNSTRWYRFALMLPRDFPIEDNRLVLFQWHGSDKKYLGEASRTPTMAFRYVAGVFNVNMRHTPERIVPAEEHVPSVDLIETRDFPLGVWHDFVIEAKWSYRDDGFINIWWNGRQVARYRGPVGYNDDAGPYVQFGLYRDETDKTYVSYVSNVRGGDSASDVGFEPPPEP